MEQISQHLGWWDDANYPQDVQVASVHGAEKASEFLNGNGNKINKIK